MFGNLHFTYSSCSRFRPVGSPSVAALAGQYVCSGKEKLWTACDWCQPAGGQCALHRVDWCRVPVPSGPLGLALLACAPLQF